MSTLSSFKSVSLVTTWANGCRKIASVSRWTFNGDSLYWNNHSDIMTRFTGVTVTRGGLFYFYFLKCGVGILYRVQTPRRRSLWVRRRGRRAIQPSSRQVPTALEEIERCSWPTAAYRRRLGLEKRHNHLSTNNRQNARYICRAHQGRAQNYSLGPRPKSGIKAENGGGRVLWEGQQPPPTS